MLRKKKCSFFHKFVLVLAMILACAIMFSQADWVYHRVHAGVGTDIAETTLAFDVSLTLILVACGFAMGHFVDWLIRRRKSFFSSTQSGPWTDAFLSVWGYERLPEEASPAGPSSEIRHGVDASDALPVLPRRRGRKPTFTLERWLPIALQWENRDPTWDAFTLADLIAEHLGTNSDGSPVVSEQAYYTTWRDRALEELQRRAQAGQSKAGLQTREKA